MLKIIKSKIKRFFGFTRAETNGFVIMIILFPVIILLPPFTKYYLRTGTDQKYNNTKHLDSLLSVINSNIADKGKNQSEWEISQSQLATFNPNSDNLAQLLAAGLSKKVASQMINYRNQVGLFKVKSDVKKLYALTEESYQRILPFINLPDKTENVKNRTIVKNESHAGKSETKNILYNINEIDSITLKTLYGLGDVLSKRIVNFREKLGGFVDVEQLKQVYGLSEKVYERNSTYFFVDEHYIPKKLKINDLNGFELSRHPYISRKTSAAIENYREIHGKFDSIEQLKDIHMISENDYKKIKPYLSL